MSSNYVKITSSPGEIIGIGTGMMRMSGDLSSAISPIAEKIKSLSDENVLKSDKFTESFRTNTYDAVSPDAAGDHTPAHEAVLAGADACAKQLGSFGELLVNAMASYVASDMESGKEIKHTATRAGLA
jgi:hypothetical protein